MATMVSRDQRAIPVVGLVLLIIGGIVFAVGVALPYWLEWSDTNRFAGLWHSCDQNSCDGLSYDDFSVPEIEDKMMPSAWIATQGLACTAIACAIIGCIAYVVWIGDVLNRTAAITATAFHYLAGVFGVAAVIVFGVYWGDFPNGLAFWLAVGGAAFCLLVGMVLACIVVCRCGGYNRRRRYVRRRRVARQVIREEPLVINDCPPSQMSAQVPMAVPIIYMNQPAIEAPKAKPKPQPQPQPQQVVIQTQPQDLQVTALYNGPTGGFYEGTMLPDNGQHSATIYVDSTYANTIPRY